MWQIKDKLEPMDLGNGYYIVRFYTKEEYDHVLQGGPWIIMGHYLTVQKWKPYFRPATETINSTLVWIRFPELPVELFHPDVLKSLGSLIGKHDFGNTNQVDDLRSEQGGQKSGKEGNNNIPHANKQDTFVKPHKTSKEQYIAKGKKPSKNSIGSRFDILGELEENWTEKNVNEDNREELATQMNEDGLAVMAQAKKDNTTLSQGPTQVLQTDAQNGNSFNPYGGEAPMQTNTECMHGDTRQDHEDMYGKIMEDEPHEDQFDDVLDELQNETKDALEMALSRIPNDKGDLELPRY
ncbi:hypothetical protein BUALT_Bualt01G0196300 [Buddleja alternifolia]|uniref:DUF4283 domain-containing protein n=1 Tax=Buddleja alternifolia TaxID=168488 RepID=A0AAV6Y8G7_9LAMI|nr:hypothetical protein BUALT_Bualt01G0196300 [Buddleja alternifolia]